MKPLFSLYQLAKKMRKGEKRHFNILLHAGTGRKALRYAEMFELVSGMKEYDEEKIITAFPTGIPKSTESRICALVMRSLRLLRIEEMETVKLHSLLDDAAILIEKELYLVARRKVRQAEKLALQTETFDSLAEILNLETQIFLKNPHCSYNEFFEGISKRETYYLQMLSRKSQLFRLNSQIRTFAYQYLQAKSQIAQDRCLEIYAATNKLGVPPAQEFFASIYYYNILGVFHFAHQQHSTAFNQFANLNAYWEAHPHWIYREPELYLGMINNYLAVALQLKHQHEAFKKTAQKLRQLKNLSENFMLKFERISFQQEILLYMNFGGEESEVQHFLSELAVWLTQNGDQLAPARMLAISYNLMMLHFVRGEFRKSNQWVLKILQMPPGQDRIDIRDFTRIFQAFLQIEIGDFDLQEYLTRSAYRYLKRSNRLFQFEKAVINLIQGLLKGFSDQSPKVISALKEFLLEIEGLKTTEEEFHLLGLTEIRFWVESRLAGVGLKEYYGKKLQERKNSSPE